MKNNTKRIAGVSYSQHRKKELSKGQKMLVNIKSRNGGTITDRKLMIEEVTAFFRVNCTEGIAKGEGEAEEGGRTEENEEEDFSRILRWEVRRELKRAKRGKAPGLGNVGINLVKDFEDVLEKY